MTLTGESQNNFLGVTYKGSMGWAFSDFLNTSGGNDGGGPTGKSAVTTDTLNLRAGPGTSSAVLSVMPSGATVALRTGSQNNFLAVTYNGIDGWASADFLNTTGGNGGGSNGGNAVTTDSLNLRDGPSVGDTVLDVMPAGSNLTMKGAEQNDYVSVTFNGVDGWAAASFIDATGGDRSGAATTITAVNLRSSAAIDNNVVKSLAKGATVTLTGNAEAGFLSVSVDDVTGWIYAAYLAR